MNLRLFTDGGSRGNPGPAAYGFVVYSNMPTAGSKAAKNGAVIVLEKCGKYLGNLTNNQAEYAGLIAGLTWIVHQNFPISSLDIFMDSLLIVNQVKGLYQVKSPSLKPKLREVRGLLSKFPRVTISYVPRAQNAVADSLVNEALDQQLQ